MYIVSNNLTQMGNSHTNKCSIEDHTNKFYVILILRFGLRVLIIIRVLHNCCGIYQLNIIHQ